MRRFLGGAWAGPALMAAVFLAELVAGVNLEMMGVHDAAIQRTIVGRYGALLLRQQLEVLGAYLVVGAGLGLATAATLSLWERVRGTTSGRARRACVVAAGVGLIEAWRIAVTVVRYPQLYVEALHAHGGARRAIEEALTDHVPLRLLVAGGWLAIAGFVGGPLLAAPGRALARRAVASARARLQGRRRRFAAAGALASIALLLGAHHRRAVAATDDQPPNVLILAVDSLRADRVGPGHEAIAPHLAELAARGVRFEHAYVTIPRTFSSWSTLLSGRWPAHHGIRHMFPDAAMRSAAGPMLPGALAARGYRTAVVSDFSGEIFSRLDAGFAERRVPYFDMKVVISQAGFNLHPSLFPWVASALGHELFPPLASAPENADPDRLADRVIDAIDDVSGRGPFFVTAFFSTPHYPYAAPDPYYRRFTRPDYRGPFRYDKPVGALDGHEPALHDEDVAQIRGLYDGAVASVDAAIGRVLEALARRHLDRRTIVVLLADHGEDLYEPGHGMGHGEQVRGDHTLHIPLVVLDPVHRFPAHAVPGIVRDVDLAPTLAALVGASLPKADGVDLGPLLRGDRTSLGLDAYAETGLWLIGEGPGWGPDDRLPYPPLPSLVTIAPDDDVVLAPSLRELVLVAKHRALRTDRWKLIYQPTRTGIRWRLFDVTADPDEQHDVASQHEEVVAELRPKLYDWMTLDGSQVEAGFVVPPR